MIWTQNLQDPTGNLYRVYADETYKQYEDLIFKDSFTGKKVYFTTASMSPLSFGEQFL